MNRIARVAFSALAVLGAISAFNACSSEPEIRYGNPATLNKDNLPEAGIEPLACGDASSPIAADGGCTVSWKNELHARMIGNDGWQCATAACHAPGKQEPAIDPANASAALTALKGYRMSTHPALAYIETSKDPAKSSFECNVGGACNPAMPIGAGKQLTALERCKVHAWLQCGAPDN